jgi:hypothetical protein
VVVAAEAFCSHEVKEGVGLGDASIPTHHELYYTSFATITLTIIYTIITIASEDWPTEEFLEGLYQGRICTKYTHTKPWNPSNIKRPMFARKYCSHLPHIQQNI